jgi:hypothetical protein
MKITYINSMWLYENNIGSFVVNTTVIFLRDFEVFRPLGREKESRRDSFSPITESYQRSRQDNRSNRVCRPAKGNILDVEKLSSKQATRNPETQSH